MTQMSFLQFIKSEFTVKKGLAGAGGLIRDPLGRWVQGYCVGLGITNSITAELRGLPEGLKMAIQLQISHLIIEMDALAVVHIFNSDKNVSALLTPLVSECRKTLGIIPNKVIKHIFREANQCAESADLLANLGVQQQSPMLLPTFVPPPEGVTPLMSF